MRFLLVAVFTAALIGNGLTALSLDGSTSGLTAINATKVDVLLAEVVDQNDDSPVGQTLALNAFTRSDNPSGNVNPAAPGQDTRQTNPDRHRDHLYRLKLALLI